MAIYDLTGGKYPSLVTAEIETSVYGFLKKGRALGHLLWHIHDTPSVFLVETSQSCTLAVLPGGQTAVMVPEDTYVSSSGGGQEPPSTYAVDNPFDLPLHLWDLKKWSELPQREEEPVRTYRTDDVHRTVCDRLGVYTRAVDDHIPHRIFVWVDKIEACAGGDLENASALLVQVIQHEIAHSMMDMNNSYAIHNDIFTYSHPAYRFIEEGLANGLSMHWCMETFNPKQQLFIDNFVMNQGLGYSEGSLIFHSSTRNQVEYAASEWRWSKSMFDGSIANALYRALAGNRNGSWLAEMLRNLREIHRQQIASRRSK